MKASSRGLLNIAKLLIESGACINILASQSFQKCTALMLAVKLGHLQMTRLLVDSHACLDIMDEVSYFYYPFITKPWMPYCFIERQYSFDFRCPQWSGEDRALAARTWCLCRHLQCTEIFYRIE